MTRVDSCGKSFQQREQQVQTPGKMNSRRLQRKFKGDSVEESTRLGPRGGSFTVGPFGSRLLL